MKRSIKINNAKTDYLNQQPTYTQRGRRRRTKLTIKSGERKQKNDKARTGNGGAISQMAKKNPSEARSKDTWCPKLDTWKSISQYFYQNTTILEFLVDQER